MNEHDGPPVMISDEWQQSTEARRAAHDPDEAVPAEPAPEPLAVGVVEATAYAEGPQPDAEQAPIEPAEEPGPDQLGTIAAELSALRAETAHVNEILDRLHAENERLRRGESEQLLMPLFRDLMKLADDWTVMGVSWSTKETAAPSDVAQKCHDVADDAGLILERHGVESFAPGVGDAIERKQHRVVGTVVAETPELDQTVAEVRRPGFVHGEKVLKFAEVVAARHER